MTGPEARRDTDLERIEAALAEGRADAADPRERELQELALALRADAPEPEPGFARELDRRVQAGFPKPSRNKLLGLTRGWTHALAGAAALVLVAVVAIASLGGGEDAADRTTAASPAIAEPSDASGGALQLSPFSEQRNAAASQQRRVERSIQITLATPGDELQNAADGVGVVAESHRGYVLSSNVNTGEAGEAGGTFVLRVPGRELQATIADLSKLGDLRSRTENSRDMTAPYRNVQGRLGNLLLERRALRVKLADAEGTNADSIRAQIAALSQEIDALNGRMEELRRRTVYSTVSVTLEESKDDGAGAGGTGAAWDDSLHTLESLLNFFVRALGVLLPLALMAGVAGLAARTLRRRRREAPLL
jgi:hypothetical protein